MLDRRQHLGILLSLGLLLLPLFLGAGCASAQTEAPAAGPAADAACFPLSTRGRYIVDCKGNRFKLKAVNWYGGSDIFEVPGGLDKQPLATLVAHIKKLGFNTVRLPFSNEMLHPEWNPNLPQDAATRCKVHWKTSVPCIDLQKNPNLHSLTPLEVYDAVVKALTDQGIAVILNNHTTSSKWCCGFDGNGLWPDSGWEEDWEMMVHRYAQNKAVAGVDLRNEVRPSFGKIPIWLGQSLLVGKDWGLAARSLARRLQLVNQDVLIIVEGINYQVDRRPHLKPVERAPLVPYVGDKLIYAAHNYGYIGPENTGHPYDTRTRYRDMNASQLAQTLESEWAFVLKPDQPYTAPVWLSEFGVAYDADKKDATWFHNLVDFLIKKDVDFAYWGLNGEKLQSFPTTGKVEEEKFGLVDRDWSAVLNDWRLDELKLLLASGMTGKVSKGQFLPMRTIIGGFGQLLDNNALGVDWHPGFTKVSCPLGYRMVGVSGDHTILCTNAAANPDLQPIQQYQRVDTWSNPPTDWAQGHDKFECPKGYYAVGISFNAQLFKKATSIYCEKSAAALASTGSARIFDKQSDRHSFSGGTWSKTLMGQCKDDQYVIGVATKRRENPYPSAALCVN